ncbi:unnamed protein product [Closterium sp. Yama58-4]|nr:unnamed protein product [Closterium sp. Yama58-4]
MTSETLPEHAGAPQMASPCDASDTDWVINLWSGPRSLSTSLMYSFAQRPDTEVVDEPLYADFLTVTGAPRPYRQLVLDSMDSDGTRVVDEVPSFGEVSPPSLSETALPHLLTIHSSLSHMGRPPPVVDATRLQTNPQGVLMALCQALDIPFYPEMLSWPAGKRPEDGVWAPWWYTTTHASTGFAPPALYPKPFPMDHYSLLEECRPFYSLLHSKALVPLTTTDNSSTTTPITISPSTSTSPLPSPPLPVPANERLLVWVGEEGLVQRRDAKVHVLDSAVQGGDAVLEGLRVYDGRIFKLQEHLDRLFDSAKAMAFANMPTREHVVHALVSTLAANGMRDNAHVRLTLTRGKKTTSGMSPQFNLYGCTLIVLAEWKPPVYDNARGIKLVTASTRRNSPQCVDSHIHHNNLINNILAKIEGNNAGADDAVMLDVHGYVSETNATNIFMVKRGRILTPHADSCLPGITRATVMELARQEGIPIQECNITMGQLHAADEIFTTGTMGELTPSAIMPEIDPDLDEKNPPALDEDDIALLKTYGLGPYSTSIKKVEKDIKDMAKKVNDLCGIKESDTGLAAPSQWDLVSDKQMMQEEQPLQVARCTKIINPNTDDAKYVINVKQIAKFVVGLGDRVSPTDIEEGMRVGVDRNKYQIQIPLPPKIDPSVTMMTVEEKPDVTYGDVGGCKEQIEKMREVVELPMLHPEKFVKLGIDPPKGVLCYGPPGTGKTLLARAVANRTDACFIRVIGSELVQKYVGEGARMVRELFQMARSKKACIIFFDEVDAIGGARFDDGAGGDNEVQRTMLEIVNQLDGFDARGNIKVLMATNRPDTLDPALLRPGRLDRKVEFGLPDLEGRTHIFKIHTRTMNCERDIRFELLARLCPNSTGADIRSVCTEAGMYAIRARRKTVTEKDFLEAVNKVIKGYQKFSATPKYMVYN